MSHCVPKLAEHESERDSARCKRRAAQPTDVRMTPPLLVVVKTFAPKITNL